MRLAFVTHDIKTNTLEALWLGNVIDADGEIESFKIVKRRNYSAEQKAEFEADLGEAATKYVTMAGW
jgi:hypothetical protein